MSSTQSVMGEVDPTLREGVRAVVEEATAGVNLGETFVMEKTKRTMNETLTAIVEDVTTIFKRDFAAQLAMQRIALRTQRRKSSELAGKRDAALDFVKKLKHERDTMQTSILSLKRKETKLMGDISKIHKEAAKNKRKMENTHKTSLKQVQGEIKKLADELSFRRKEEANNKRKIEAQTTSLEQAQGEIRKLADELSLTRKEEANNKRMMEEMHKRSLKQARQDCKRVRKIFRLVELKKSSLASQLASVESRLREVEVEKSSLAGRLASTEKEKSGLQVAHERCQLALSEEKEKGLCEICMESPKDTICLPCLHLRYCFECLEKHRQFSRTCPFCRVLLNGVIRSHISMFTD